MEIISNFRTHFSTLSLKKILINNYVVSASGVYVFNYCPMLISYTIFLRKYLISFCVNTMCQFLVTNSPYIQIKITCAHLVWNIFHIFQFPTVHIEINTSLRNNTSADRQIKFSYENVVFRSIDQIVDTFMLCTT